MRRPDNSATPRRRPTLERWIIRSLAVTWLVLALAMAWPAEAHEKWFVDARKYPIRWEDVFSFKTGLVIVVILALLGAVLVAQRVLGERLRLPERVVPRDVQWERIYGWVPLILGVHAAVPMIAAALQLRLFAPNLFLPNDIWGGLFGLAQIMIGLSFVYGALTRYFAALLLLLFPLSFLLLPVPYVLEHLDLAGCALFFLILGRGPYSVDALISIPQPRIPREWANRAVPLLRIATGCAFVVLGFTEKVWNNPMSVEFLHHKENFNFMPAIGITWFTDERFIIAAAMVEVLVGAMLISGAFTRLVVAIAWVPFNLTLPFMGAVEFIGHLSVYGIFLVLLLWTGKDLIPHLHGLSGAEAEESEPARAASPATRYGKAPVS